MRRYTKRELERLSYSVDNGVALSEMAHNFRRSASSIAYKLRSLTEQDPQAWDPAKTDTYWREIRRKEKDRYKRKHPDRIEEQKKRYSERCKGKWLRFGTYLSGLIGDEWGAKQETAVHLGIRPCELSQYLGGNKRPGEELLRKVSEMFGVSYDKLYSVAHLWKSCQTDYDTDSSLSRL